jgi:hypothetical protein
LHRHAEADWGEHPRFCQRSSRALVQRARTMPLVSFYRLAGKYGLLIATNPSCTHTAVRWTIVHR